MFVAVLVYALETNPKDVTVNNLFNGFYWGVVSIVFNSLPLPYDLLVLQSIDISYLYHDYTLFYKEYSDSSEDYITLDDINGIDMILLD